MRHHNQISYVSFLTNRVFFQQTHGTFYLLVCKFNGKKFFQGEIVVLQDRKSLW